MSYRIELLNFSLAHSVIVNSRLYPGYNNRIQTNPPHSIGWFADNPGDDFITPAQYAHPDIICHRSAVPAPAHLPVLPGDRIHLQWNGWPLGHAGPVLTSLAKCDSPTGCASVNKTDLKFFTIDDSAPVLLAPTGGPPGGGPPGVWATNVLINANNSWTVEIPPRLPPGAYVLRHEIIALHYATRPDGAQNYPQCINLWVGNATAGAGQGVPMKTEGKRITEFYKATDKGVTADVFAGPTSYEIPGPKIVDGAVRVPMAEQKPMLITGQGTPVVVRDGKAMPYSG